MPATTTYSATGNAYVDGVLGTTKWAVTELTFSFPTSASFYGTRYGSGEPGNNFGTLSAAQQAAARATFDAFSSVTNLKFTEIGETSTRHADLRLALSDAPSTAWAYTPSTAAEGGDVWFNKTSGYYASPVKGNYANATFIHEIGHALGLEHAHEAYVMPADRDSMEYTIMSYRSYVGATLGGGYTNEKWGFAQSPMMYDIAALQHMYGADYSTNSGDTRYTWNSTTGEMLVNGVGQGAPGANRIFLTVWDGGGTDTYDFSNYATDLKVDLRPGNWTTTSSEQLARLHYDGSKVAAGNIANALLHNNDARSLVENAIGGSGNDEIFGNTAANVLIGGSGADTMRGDKGNDTYEVTDAGDRVIENAGEGYDTIWSGVDHVLATHVESLYLAGGAASAHGNALDNVIDTTYSSALHNVLIGGLGADVMRGGKGDDTYEVTDAGDRVIENAGEGHDTVWSAVDYVLAANVEDLYLAGGAASAQGNECDNVIDTTYSSALNNVLIGGLGADIMRGGKGDDTYEVTDAGDQVLENAGEGYDTIWSSIDCVLVAHIEGLYLAGGASFAQGTAFDNVIDTTYSTALHNVLIGGLGSDTMRGGKGNDTYEVTDTGDRVIENAGEGYDTVWSAVDHVLAAHVETLYLAGGAQSARGNALDNVIDATYSSAVRTTLAGGGGADLMIGGSGADNFLFSAASDSLSTSKDSIRNFLSGTDKIDLHLIDANSNVAGDQGFSYIGGNSFTRSAGQLNFRNGVVSGDVNGDGLADFQIDVQNVSVLVESDFYL